MIFASVASRTGEQCSTPRQLLIKNVIDKGPRNLSGVSDGEASGEQCDARMLGDETGVWRCVDLRLLELFLSQLRAQPLPKKRMVNDQPCGD